MPQKRIVVDITKDYPKRLNASNVCVTTRLLRLEIGAFVKVFAVTAIFLSFFAGSVINAPQNFPYASAQEQDNNSDKITQRAELERQLAEYEKQIEETQKTIDEYKKKGTTLKNEISTLNAKINKLNLQIKAVNVTLSKLNQDINATQKKINQTENKIEEHKKALARTLQDVYENDNENFVTIFLANNRLSDFFGKLNDIELVQNKIRIALEDITKLRQDLLGQKEELFMEKEDAENLRAIQQTQKKNVDSIKNQTTNLLTTTKGKETEYQKILAKTKESAAEIRSRIFELLGGGELTFEKAYNFAKLAEGATDVRAALILAVLHRESLLGKNTGRCFYNQKMPGGTTAMNPKQTPIFLEITEKLKIDPNSAFAKISCPNQDGTYGGAMGPAQFIPSTWKIYEERIMQVTGNNPPSPWNNSDAFVASALYLKNFGADSKTTAAEKKAAAIYYCGTNWQRYSCSYYAGKVIESANRFQDDINILEGK